MNDERVNSYWLEKYSFFFFFKRIIMMIKEIKGGMRVGGKKFGRRRLIKNSSRNSSEFSIFFVEKVN